MMRINWVFAAECKLDPEIDIEKLKSIGPTWGSWTTWRACATDNVICDGFAKSRDLFKRDFQKTCNFYIPRRYYLDLGRPTGAKFYDGEYQEQVDNIEDIIAMQIASTQSDIVLLLGFDWVLPTQITDRFDKHKIMNYHGLVRSTISNSKDVQWVAVTDQTPDRAYADIANLNIDTLDNVLNMF